MFSYLLNLLSTKIEIEVSPDRFVFKRNDEIKGLATKVYISKDSNRTLFLGFGDEFTATQSNICVELFKETHDRKLPNTIKSECLVVYFRYAFRLITKRCALVRPQVVFKNSQSLSRLLCGYQDSLLLAAVTDAGARVCIFEN